MYLGNQIEEIRNVSLLKIFNLLKNDNKEILPFEIYSTGITLHSIINDENSDMLLPILNCLSLPENHKIAFCYHEMESFGNNDIIVELPTGEKDKNYLKYLKVEHSKKGAWQIYLLYSIWRTLRLYDHSNYSRRKFLYSDKEIKSLPIKEKKIQEAALKLDIEINIFRYSDYYYISYCYWNMYSGINRIYAEIKFRDNQVIDIQEFGLTNLIEYGRDLRI